MIVVYGSVVFVCNVSVGVRKEFNGCFNEFDILLIVLVLFLCIGGIFMCVWFICCGYYDYFIILD